MRRGTGKRPGLLSPALRIAAVAAIGYAAKDRLAKADRIAFDQMRNRRNPTLDRVLPVATDAGSMYAAVGVAAALALTGQRKIAMQAIGAATTAWAVAQASKKIFNRERPYEDGTIADGSGVLVRKPAGLSYPSGHPAVAAALSGVLAPHAGPIVRPLLEKMPAFVGASRVYVGVHYPSDVIGGRLLGGAVADLWRRYAR